jgi:ABC-type phosphate transport system substrate-binding protein
VELRDDADVDFALKKFEQLWSEAIDVNEDYINSVQNKTWLNDKLLPYFLYLKTIYEYFKEEILAGSEYRQDALVQPATGAIVQEIAQNKGAIGYIGYAYVDNSVKALALDGGDGIFVPATQEKILSGEYPLARELFYYTNGEPHGLTKEFMDYVMSAEGQSIVSEVGYFPAI